MDIELLWDGIKAMILGMAMVYLFLTVMIRVVKLTSKLLAPYAERFEPQKAAPAKKKAPAAALSDEKLAHAAVAAVELFKKSGKAKPSRNRCGGSCRTKTPLLFRYTRKPSAIKVLMVF